MKPLFLHRRRRQHSQNQKQLPPQSSSSFSSPASLRTLSQSQARSPLCQIPLDLLECIRVRLDTVDRTCLALTCKGLWETLHPGDLAKISNAGLEKFEFLMRFERMFEEQESESDSKCPWRKYPCHKCMRLHRVRKTHSRHQELWRLKRRILSMVARPVEDSNAGWVEICPHKRVRDT